MSGLEPQEAYQVTDVGDADQEGGAEKDAEEKGGEEEANVDDVVDGPPELNEVVSTDSQPTTIDIPQNEKRKTNLGVGPTNPTNHMGQEKETSK